MKIRCIAIDDEPIALEKLENYIYKVPYLELVAKCEGAFEAMEILSRGNIDAVFIDINMPDINGLDFISSLQNPPMVVFTTAYAEYGAESYKVNAVDYLLKPFGFNDFQRSASKLASKWNLHHAYAGKSQDHSLYLKADYKYIRVDVNDISYIEGMSEYLKIHIADSTETIITHMSMRQIMETLPEHFLQVHRSYIVNMQKIKEIEKSRIVLDKKRSIPIGDNYRDGFVKYIQSRTVTKK